MVAFDGETYLRLLGERLLADRESRNHHRSPLELPTAALLVAGAISHDRATRVIADHDAALRVRAGEHGLHRLGSATTGRTPGRLPPRQTMLIAHEFAFGGGTLLLRDLAIGPEAATIRFRWRSDTPGSRRRGRMFGGGGPNPWGSAPPPVIADDHGNRPTVSPGSGGGSDSQWEGELRLSGPLSATTEWLEIEGTRVVLDRRVAPSRTWIEPLEEEEPVPRFLRRRLSVPEMPFARPVELAPALDALRAAGALASHEPLVAELAAVATRLPGHRGGAGSGAAGTSRRLPEPWRALLKRVGKDDGPTLSLVLGTVTPPFDGVQVVVRSVESDRNGFDIEFEVAPNVLYAPALGELPVAWWARDDRGNRHLGSADNWSGSDESASGTMRFWPALDPRATRLELVICAQRHRAVIAIPLGEVA